MTTLTFARRGWIRSTINVMVASGIGYTASGQQASVREQLAASRQQIDKIDAQIVQLINQRAAIVSKVGRIKSDAGLPVAAPDREQAILKRVADLGSSGPFPASRLQSIYSTLLAQMREWEAEQQPR